MTSLILRPRLLGIDYGTKKTGLAISGPLGTLCTPLSTVPTSKIMDELDSRIEEYQVSKIIVGWPLQEDGSAQQTTKKVEEFIARLKKKFNGKIPIEAWDERYSSMRARALLKESGVGKKKRNQRGTVDAVAAVIILEEYLEANPFPTLKTDDESKTPKD